jgi:hypothetical protein
MAKVNCYSVIEAELSKGPRTEGTLINKCVEAGFAERGAKVALTRGGNAGTFRVETKENGTRTFSA